MERSKAMDLHLTPAEPSNNSFVAERVYGRRMYHFTQRQWIYSIIGLDIDDHSHRRRKRLDTVVVHESTIMLAQQLLITAMNQWFAPV